VPDVRVHLVDGNVESDVLLSRVPCVGERISMTGLPEDVVLRVEGVLHRAFLSSPPVSEFEAIVRVSRVRLGGPA
jgi:hypothetical protein